MKQEPLTRALKEHALISKLPEAHVAFLSGCTKNVRYDEDEYVFKEGQEANQLFLVRRGKIALEVYDPQGGTATVETLHSGDVVGWSTIFPPYRWHVDARAMKDTMAFAIDGECLRKKLEADHDFGYAFTRLMLREVHRRLERLHLQSLDVYKAGDDG